MKPEIKAEIAKANREKQKWVARMIAEGKEHLCNMTGQFHIGKTQEECGCYNVVTHTFNQTTRTWEM
jgi:hypothetical protein